MTEMVYQHQPISYSDRKNGEENNNELALTCRRHLALSPLPPSALRYAFPSRRL